MTGWCCAFVGLATTLCLLDHELASPFVGVFFVSVAFAGSALPGGWSSSWPRSTCWHSASSDSITSSIHGPSSRR
jgi:hypothetical protein